MHLLVNIIMVQTVGPQAQIFFLCQRKNTTHQVICSEIYCILWNINDRFKQLQIIQLVQEVT